MSDITYEDTVALWQSFNVKNSKVLAAYLENFAVLFAYNSGAIENPEISYRDTHEVFENGKVCGYTGSLRTLYEIQNMKDAYKLMCGWFDERRPLDKDVVKQMHYELTKGTYDERRLELGERPGEFKKNDIWGVGKNDIAAPLGDVKSDLETDLAEITDIDDKDALTAAAFFHARFEGIHAFADGNGRTGRALMNYFLLLHNHPPIVIYQEAKKAYYGALESFDKDGNLVPLKSFLADQACKTWEKAVRRYAVTLEKPLSLGAVVQEMRVTSRDSGLNDSRRQKRNDPER